MTYTTLDNDDVRRQVRAHLQQAEIDHLNATLNLDKMQAAHKAANDPDEQENLTARVAQAQLDVTVATAAMGSMQSRYTELGPEPSD